MDTAHNGLGQETSAGSVTSSATAPATTAPTQSANANDTSRVFTQDQVNDIVKKAKYGAVEDYKRLSSQQPDYAARKNEDTPLHSSHSQNFDENHYRKIASQEAQRLRDEWVQEARTKAESEHAQRIVQTFWNKIAPGKEKYQDFEQVTGTIDFVQFPNVVQLLAQHAENADEILYAFGKDRIKMSQLEYLASKSKQDAIAAVQRLSESLKDNEAASKVRVPNEPLSKLRPSNAGTDNGVMTVSDYRKKYRV